MREVGRLLPALSASSAFRRHSTRRPRILRRARLNPNTHPTMSDPTTSGVTPAAPAAAPTETVSAPPAGAFGTSRGTGLLRGKRPSQTAASANNPATAGAAYQPSTIQVVKVATEYKNPFAPEPEPAPAPVAPVAPPVAAPALAIAPPAAPPAPVEQPAPAPALVAPTPVTAREDRPSFSPSARPPVRPEPGSVGQNRNIERSDAPATEMFPFTPSATKSTPPPAAAAEKARLNILPPAETKRSEQSWESGPPRAGQPDRQDERPSFRPERRESRRPDNGDPARSYDSRPPEPRRDAAKLDSSAPAVPIEVQSGGFLNWLKGLFGGGKTTKKSSSSSSSSSRSGESSREGRESSRDGHRSDGGHRHHHRGGRGRHSGSSSGGERSHSHEGGSRPEGSGGESSGSGHDGHRSGGGRRRRGGRGRNSRDGGGGYPRQEEGHRNSGGGSGLAPPPGS